VSRKGKALEDAISFLHEVLSGRDCGVPSAEVLKLAARRGISERTLRRAITKLSPRLFARQHGWHGPWHLHWRDEASAKMVAERDAKLAELEAALARLENRNQ
jgi:hypothetical protein